MLPGVEDIMKIFSGALALLIMASLSYGQSMDPNVERIRHELDAYINDFSSRDFDAMATHFEVPAVFKTNPPVIATTHEEVADFFRSFPLQEGYAYSRIDRVEIHRLNDSMYSTTFDFARYNSSDELLFEGSSLYIFSNEIGAWKIFTLWTGDREARID